MKKLQNAFPAENAVSAVVLHLIMPHGLRHYETLNGLNQVKEFEQKSKWSKYCKHAHHLRKCKWLETNKVAAE